MTNKLSPWREILLEKLMVHRLLKKFSAFYGTRRFIAVTTSQSLAPILSHIPAHASPSYFSINLPFMLRSSWWSRPYWFSDRNFVHISQLPHAFYMTNPSHSP